MTAKRKLAMSGVAIITVLTLVAGSTMAWFHDTEKVNANFEAGVLDISVSAGKAKTKTPLTFENLRPMKDKEAYLTEINAVWDSLLKGENYYEGKGYDPEPVYVQEFTITNNGTLPLNLKLEIEDNAPAADDKIWNIVDNGYGGVKHEGEDVSCKNELGKAYVDGAFTGDDNTHFNFVLLQKSDDGQDWNDVKDLTIAEFKGGHVLMDGDKELVLPAGGEGTTVTYALGAYLDSDTENMYQGKEYHVTMNVLASQTDEGAIYG